MPGGDAADEPGVEQLDRLEHIECDQVHGEEALGVQRILHRRHQLAEGRTDLTITLGYVRSRRPRLRLLW